MRVNQNLECLESLKNLSHFDILIVFGDIEPSLFLEDLNHFQALHFGITSCGFYELSGRVFRE